MTAIVNLNPSWIPTLPRQYDRVNPPAVKKESNGVPLQLGGNNGLNNGENGGVYTRHPATLLKYATSWENSPNTQARLYISIPGIDASAVSNRFDDAAAPYVDVAARYGYIDFLLQNAAENYTEKFQVSEVLGDNYAAYFYGQHASMFQYSGMLLSTVQDDWWVGFTTLYQAALRGTKLAEVGALVHLRYDSRVVTGALTDFGTNLGADMQMAVNFRFSLLVKNVATLPSPYGIKPTATASNGVGGIGPIASLIQPLELEESSSTLTTVRDGRNDPAPKVVTPVPTGPVPTVRSASGIEAPNAPSIFLQQAQLAPRATGLESATGAYFYNSYVNANLTPRTTGLESPQSYVYVGSDKIAVSP